jgi:SAM-dependent methyltransferase
MSYRYVGAELDVFAGAVNWKTYAAQKIERFIGGRVLEVGAGIGENVRFLLNRRVCEWTCLEPDPDLAGRIKGRLLRGDLPPKVRGDLPPKVCVVTGTTASLDRSVQFDTILYLDVLEHIAEDRAELAQAAQLLAPEGHIVVLGPAHQFLFSAFDIAVGHYRRYNRAMLVALTPPGCRLEMSMMLDTAGFSASLANRVLLSTSLPSKRQIALWDRVLVPISRVLDRATAYRFGKTVIVVWRWHSKASGSPLRRRLHS